MKLLSSTMIWHRGVDGVADSSPLDSVAVMVGQWLDLAHDLLRLPRVSPPVPEYPAWSIAASQILIFLRRCALLVTMVPVLFFMGLFDFNLAKGGSITSGANLPAKTAERIWQRDWPQRSRVPGLNNVLVQIVLPRSEIQTGLRQ